MIGEVSTGVWEMCIHKCVFAYRLSAITFPTRSDTKRPPAIGIGGSENHGQMKPASRYLLQGWFTDPASGDGPAYSGRTLMPMDLR